MTMLRQLLLLLTALLCTLHAGAAAYKDEMFHDGAPQRTEDEEEGSADITLTDSENEYTDIGSAEEGLREETKSKVTARPYSVIQGGGGSRGTSPVIPKHAVLLSSNSQAHKNRNPAEKGGIEIHTTRAYGGEGGEEGAGRVQEVVLPAAKSIDRPGLLIGLVCGAVVVLLLTLLLVLFAVYRLRKKDEGSYALDEPKDSPAIGYVQSHDREFFA